MDKLKIVSLNTRGIKNKLKRISLFTFLKNKKYDIICLQETHVTSSDVDMWKKQWGGEIFYHQGTNHSKGEMILVAKHCDAKVLLEKSCERMLLVSVTQENFSFSLLNIYAPNQHNEKIIFLQKLKELSDDFSDKNLLIMGDFNCVLDPKMDVISGQPYNETEVKQFNNFIDSSQLTDVWRTFYRNDSDFTWSRTNPFIARRLDYCLMTSQLLSSCVSCEHISMPNSDHKAIAIELKESTFLRGPGYWRFNNSFLKNTDFVDKMNNLLDQYTSNEVSANTSMIEKWELCKVEIRNFCTEFGKVLACKKRNEESQLYAQMLSTEKQLINSPTNEILQNQLLQQKQKLELIQLNKAKGAQVRARMKWIEDGERNTKYFCNLEKHNGKKKIISRLRTESGEVVTDQNKIMQEQVSFYQKLYSQKTPVENVREATNLFLANEPLPHLTEDEAALCEDVITVEETSNALRKLKNGTAPGSDGITIEFMKFFWGKISGMVTNSFIESFNNGELSYTQKHGIITLLHKGKELEKDKLNNWRPITLTNSDYKILAKLLAERLSMVINSLVSEDQVGYLKGRNAATVLRSIDDTINYINKTGKPGYLLAVDYSKAFDSISRSFLLHAFQIFGFGANFQKWVSIITNGNISSINHGGWVSEPFDISCGIKQGCPFSPLAFVLAVELLAIKIRNSSITGVEVPHSTATSNLKIKQLADDTTLFLKDKEDMNKSLQILSSFERFSGLKLNKDKTKALYLGSQERDQSLPFTTVNKIKILGIYFETNKMAKTIEENWNGRIHRLMTLIKEWSKRDLSIAGKVVVAKTFLISQFIYVMQSVGLPLTVLNKVNTTLYKFLWQKKHSNRRAFEKVKRKVVEAEYDKGGLKMTNMLALQKHFNLQWIGKLYDAGEEENWSFIPKWHLNKLAKDEKFFFVNCKSNTLKNIGSIENEFWTDIISTYLDNKNTQKISDIHNGNFHSQLLFNNVLIKYKNNVLFFQDWYRNGIERMKDIIHREENRLLSLSELQNLIGRNKANTIFEYNALMNSIPKPWFQWIQEGQQETESLLCEAASFNKKPKELRKMLSNEKEDTVPVANSFWQNKFSFDLDKPAWARAIESTKETRLRVLHWKILHNIYPTNILLNKMKVTETNKCSYCQDTVDYIEHFFYFCPAVRTFWHFIEQKILIETQVNIKLSVTDILFGVNQSDHMKEHYKLINHLLLIGKMCISIFKKTQSPFNLQLIFEKECTMRIT